MILDTFDHAFVINLDQARERYQLTVQRLRQIGVNAERFPAIVPTAQGPYDSLGARGCTESHWGCVKLAKERGYKSVLIFEDDVIFRRSFNSLWARLQPAAVTLDYELLFFFDWWQCSLLPFNLRFSQIPATVCAHAYAVHGRYYDKMLALFTENERIGKTNDLIFNQTNARIFAPSYNLVGQDAGMSNLTNQSKALRWSAHSKTYYRVYLPL